MGEPTAPVERLAPQDCRDDETLRVFIEDRIGANAWPIQSKSLRRQLGERGIDLGEARCFTLDERAADELIVRSFDRSRRAERMLRIDNAFHRTLHNFEVALRLLVLEWPEREPPPASLLEAARGPCADLGSAREALRASLRHLRATGIPDCVLARDLLAALGHDYGHTGGTDRLLPDGSPAPLTHEEAAERHVAKLGLQLRFPSALILEALAGIRATTFYSRPGRARVAAQNDFERKLTLADICGYILPKDQWLTRVGIPVLKEKLPHWKRRSSQIPLEIAETQARLAALPHDHPDRKPLEDQKEQLLAEDDRIIKDLAEWFRSERGFFLFIESQRLPAVPLAQKLWGGILRERITIIESIIEQKDLLVPLAAKGFAFLEEYADGLANAESLQSYLARDGVDFYLREILRRFLR